jgi:hypothetical protein
MWWWTVGGARGVYGRFTNRHYFLKRHLVLRETILIKQTLHSWLIAGT